MQRTGGGLAREGDGEVAGLRDAVGGVAHGEMPGARVACAHSQGGVVLVTQWACGWIGRGCDAWGGQVAAPAYGSGRRHGSGKREVEETVSGNFVIRPKFQNPVL